MRTYAVGKMSGTQTILMDKTMLTESVIGQIYELKIRTNGVPSPQLVAATLSKTLREKLNAKLLYFEVDKDVITMQIEGSPFAWSVMLVLLPEILVTLGVVVMLIMIYLVSSAIPSWQYGIMLLALAVIFLAPHANVKVGVGGKIK